MEESINGITINHFSTYLAFLDAFADVFKSWWLRLIYLVKKKGKNVCFYMFKVRQKCPKYLQQKVAFLAYAECIANKAYVIKRTGNIIIIIFYKKVCVKSVSVCSSFSFPNKMLIIVIRALFIFSSPGKNICANYIVSQKCVSIHEPAYKHACWMICSTKSSV